MWICVWVFTWPPKETCVPNFVTRHITERPMAWETHTQTMSTCTFLTQMLSPWSPWRFGNHSELCSQDSSSLYPPLFVKVFLNKSIRTSATGFDCPAWAHRWSGPVFRLRHTHYDWLIQVLMIQTQQGFGVVWTGWRAVSGQSRSASEDQWRGTAKRRLSHGGIDTTRQTESCNQQKLQIPPSQENLAQLEILFS